MIDSPLAQLMNTAFYLQGTLFFVGAVLVARAVKSQKAGLFLSLAAMNAIGNIVVGTIHGGPIAKVDGTAWVQARAQCWRSWAATWQSWREVRSFGAPAHRIARDPGEPDPCADRCGRDLGERGPSGGPSRTFCLQV